MALHELVTNSAKYGALSTVTGRLAIHWKTDADALRIVWEERAGPPVVEPTSRGFGTRSVIASIESQLAAAPSSTGARKVWFAGFRFR